MPGKVWGQITFPFLNFNGCTIKVEEWISNFTPHIIETVSPEGKFCDTVQVPSSVGDMELN